MRPPGNGAGPNVGAFEPVEIINTGCVDRTESSTRTVVVPVLDLELIVGPDRRATRALRRAALAAAASLSLSLGIYPTADGMLRAIAARGAA